MRDTSSWLREQSRNQTERGQEDVRFRIKEKVASTRQWKEELQEELSLNKKQTESLKKCLSRMKKALMKSDEPLKVI